MINYLVSTMGIPMAIKKITHSRHTDIYFVLYITLTLSLIFLSNTPSLADFLVYLNYMFVATIGFHKIILYGEEKINNKS
jgi:hypothetical protein